MRRIILFIALAGISISTSAQQVDLKHAQARIQEPMSDFYVRPMVAELEVIGTDRDFGPYPFLEGASINDITFDALQEAKAYGAYCASREAEADIILGATFYVTDNKDPKVKGLQVSVHGYPAKYVNFHNYGENADDAKWIEPLQEGMKIRNASGNLDQTKAAKAK